MTQQFQNESPVQANLQIHLIWVPKYRKKILTGDVAMRLREILRQICTEYEITIISGKIGRNYIHMFIAHKPDQSISQIAGRLKGKSANKLFRECDHLRALFPDGHLWARGYCAITAGNFSEEAAQAYVQGLKGQKYE